MHPALVTGPSAIAYLWLTGRRDVISTYLIDIDPVAFLASLGFPKYLHSLYRVSIHGSIAYRHPYLRNDGGESLELPSR